MKYYSEKLKQVFDDVESLEKAEDEFNKKYAVELKMKEERAQKAKEIETAYQEYHQAYKKYAGLVKAFVKEYGSYHVSFKSDEDGFTQLIDELWRWPF